MKPEYVALLKKWESGAIPSTKNLISACEAIADSKEPVLLTDAELLPMLRRAFGWSDSTTWGTIAKEWKPGVRAIEAAVHAKQRAPVTRDVRMRMYGYSDGSIGVSVEGDILWDKNIKAKLLDEFTRTVELK